MYFDQQTRKTMADEGFDPCECIWSHEMAMRRLLSLVSVAERQEVGEGEEKELERPWGVWGFARDIVRMKVGDFLWMRIFASVLENLQESLHSSGHVEDLLESGLIWGFKLWEVFFSSCPFLLFFFLPFFPFPSSLYLTLPYFHWHFSPFCFLPFPFPSPPIFCPHIPSSPYSSSLSLSCHL